MSVDPDVSEVCQAEETPPVDPPKYTYLPCSGPRLAAAGQKTKDKGSDIGMWRLLDVRLPMRAIGNNCLRYQDRLSLTCPALKMRPHKRQ